MTDQNQNLLDQAKNTNLQNLAQQGAQVGVNALPLSKENKEALGGLATTLVQKIVPDKTLGSLFVKPTANSVLDKPSQESSSNIPKFKGISGWDKFKNFLGKIGSKTGLTTHEITDQDYVWNPKKDKQGNVMIDPKTKQEIGDWKFDWKRAREVDKMRGRPTETQFDPTFAIGMASKIASKGVL